MKKNVFGRHFGRTTNQRKALFRGLICSLVEKGEIKTTLAKAKAIKAESEKLITKAKKGSLSDRRIIFRFLNRSDLVNKLVDEIAPLLAERKSGYLRIVRVGNRRGDNSQTAKVMFVDDILSLSSGKEKKDKNQKKNEIPEGENNKKGVKNAETDKKK